MFSAIIRKALDGLKIEKCLTAREYEVYGCKFTLEEWVKK